MDNRKIAFFDLGSTLLYFKDPWPPIYNVADLALASVLQEAGIRLDNQAFFSEFGGFLDAYYTERGDSTVEKTTAASLKELLLNKGFSNVPDGVIRAALDAMYAVTQQNWYLEKDAIPTLEMLRQRGVRLGLISNTSDDKNVQQLIDRYGLRPFFDLILTSAGCGIRKPDGRIFQMALDYFRVSGEAAIMVGDTLEADVLGANQKGIYSVWITRRTQIRGDGELTIQPQAVVATLSQVPALLEKMESK